MRCENIESCHPHILNILKRALSTGAIIDASGKKIYISDAVIILTANLSNQTQKQIGFTQKDENKVENAQNSYKEVFGEDFCDLIDIIITKTRDSGLENLERLKNQFLPIVTKRYSARGLEVSWDKSFINWFEAELELEKQCDWERLIDENVSPHLISHLPKSDDKEVKSILVSYHAGDITTEIA